MKFTLVFKKGMYTTGTCFHMLADSIGNSKAHMAMVYQRTNKIRVK